MLKIFIININQDLQQSEFNQMALLLTNEKREIIEKYHFYLDAQRAILGDILARYSICKCHNLQNNDLNFSSNEYRKPFLVNKPYIHYNISHAGRYITCVLSDSFPAGIDIEEIKQNGMEIAKRFFAKDEYNYLLSQPAKIQTETFYRIWTMKESYTKMLGKGLSMPLDSFSVIKLAETNQVDFQQFLNNEGYTGYTCSEKINTVTCEVVNCAELLLWAHTQV